MKNKKKEQLGMNPSTASARLLKDILWKFIVETGKDICCKCGRDMTRETFSIEHINPWMDSSYPIETYFDLTNIGFSHLKCNISSRRRNPKKCGTTAAYNRGCRCRDCRLAYVAYKRGRYSADERRKKYLEKGY